MKNNAGKIKEKKKEKKRELTGFYFLPRAKFFPHPKVTNLPKHGAYIEFFLGKIPLCPQKALNKEGKKGKRRKENQRKVNKEERGSYGNVPKLAPMPKIQC